MTTLSVVSGTHTVTVPRNGALIRRSSRMGPNAGGSETTHQPLENGGFIGDGRPHAWLPYAKRARSIGPVDVVRYGWAGQGDSSAWATPPPTIAIARQTAAARRAMNKRLRLR